jgi:hypothetical protein
VVEEELLRRGFISGDLDLAGDDYVVIVEAKVNERLNLRAMREREPAHVWQPYVIAAPSVYVRTARKTGDQI